MMRNIFRKKNRTHPFVSKDKMINFYKQFLPEHALVFDIGANTGNRIDIFLETGARVVAFEPQAACIEILTKKYGNKIDLEHTGLGATESLQEFYIADENTISTFSKEFILQTGATRFKRNRWEEKTLVPVTTFDRMIEKYGRPHFSKIDVEGFESEVLKGLTSKIPALSFEYCLPEMYRNLYSCLEHIHSLDANAVYNYSAGETFEMEPGGWKTYEEFLPFVKGKAFHKTLFGDIYIKCQDSHV